MILRPLSWNSLRFGRIPRRHTRHTRTWSTRMLLEIVHVLSIIVITRGVWVNRWVLETGKTLFVVEWRPILYKSRYTSESTTIAKECVLHVTARFILLTRVTHSRANYRAELFRHNYADNGECVTNRECARWGRNARFQEQLSVIVSWKSAVNTRPMHFAMSRIVR